MTILRKSRSNKDTAKVVLNILLQTARERDVLYIILSALIAKKKEMKAERDQTEKDVVRLEIYPIISNEKEMNGSASNTLKGEEKKKWFEYEKKIETYA